MGWEMPNAGVVGLYNYLNRKAIYSRLRCKSTGLQKIDD